MSDLKILKNKSIDFIYKVFAQDCINNDNLKFNSSFFNEIVKNTYNDLIQDKTTNNNPFFIRVAGQCGSGKTTQLMPSIKNNLKTNNYIHLAVRMFAKLHPNYDELLEKYGQSLIREKTNGFALMILFAVMELLILNKYNIFLEVTILEESFEEYLIKLLKNNNYRILLNIIAIPFEVSNYFTEIRMKNSIIEKNRFMPIETLNFFNNALHKSLKYIINECNIFDNFDRIIMWNLFSNEPIINTNIIDNKIIEIFNKNTQFNNNLNSYIKDEKIKLEEKNKFYSDFFKTFKIN